MIKRGAWPAASVAMFVLLALLVAIRWTPSPHQIHTPGATTISNARLAQASRPTYGYLQLTPTLSLNDLRCQASRGARTDTCPDAAALEERFWPGVTQSPNTLYLSLPPACDAFSSGGFNFEYVESNRTLILHCYTAAPWLVLPTHAPGVQAQPPAELVLVPTDSFGPGSLRVIEDDRVEHLVGDDSMQVTLGTVAIPGS